MNKPKIRFKGFQGEWKKVKIGDVAPLTGGFAFQSGQFKTSGVPIIRISNILSSGIVGGDFVYYNEFKGDSEFRLYKGDVVIAMSGATTGKVATFEANDFGYQNQRVGKFSRTNLVNYELLSKLVSAPNFQKKIISKLTSSAQPNASSKDIDSIDLVVPEETEEQRALASYFTSLDAQIAASTSRLSSLKQIKAASLLNMFPQKGETVPRVRFKGFQGEWKERKLGEVFSERVENNINGQLLSVTLNKGIIRASENGKLDNSNSDKSKYKVVNINDIAYNSMRMWQGASGCSKYEGIVSPAYTVITPKEDIDSSFFSYLFKTDIAINKFRLHSQGLTSDNWNLKYPAFSKIDVYCPLDISEQRAIASFFTTLDAQITLQRERLEKLKQIKAACLEKMFA